MEAIKYPHIEIVQAVQNGDAEAELQLYQLYLKLMFNAGFRFLSNRQDAEGVFAYKGVFIRI